MAPEVFVGDGDALVVVGDGDADVVVGDGDALLVVGEGDADVFVGDGDALLVVGVGDGDGEVVADTPSIEHAATAPLTTAVQVCGAGVVFV